MRGPKHPVTGWVGRGGVGVVLLLVLALAACRASEAPAQKPAAPSAPAAPAAAVTAAPLAPTAVAPSAPQASPVARATPAQPAAQAPAAKATKPDYGGTLTYAVAEQTPSFDLDWDSSYIGTQPVTPIFNGLTTIDISDKPGELLPDLAEKWDISADRKALTFSLRKDVKWHNGTPFTCADPKAALEKKMDLRVSVGTGMESVAAVSCKDDFTLVINLKQPDVSFLKLVGAGQVVIQRKEITEAVRAAGIPRAAITKDPEKFLIGTGPFVFDRWTPGVDLWTKRNPNYWKKDAQGNPIPYIDRIHTVIMPDLSAIFAGFRARQLTMTGIGRNLEQPTEAEILQRRYPDAVVQLFPRNAWHNIYFNTPKPPVNDKRVRQAFAYAIDQRGTIARAVEGWGALGAYIGPHLRPLALSEEELLKHPYFSTDMVARRAKARELLKEAGFPDGIKLDLWQRKGPQYDRGAIANVADLKLAGIDVTLRLLDTAANTDLLNSGNFLINTTPSATSVDDPTGYLDDFVCNMGVSINRSRYCNPDYDKLFYAQNQEFDPAKRAQILHQMELLLLDDMPEHRSYYWMQVMGVWNRVQGWQLSVGDQVYNFRRFETVWCKEGKCQ